MGRWTTKVELTHPLTQFSNAVIVPSEWSYSALEKELMCNLGDHLMCRYRRLVTYFEAITYETYFGIITNTIVVFRGRPCQIMYTMFALCQRFGLVTDEHLQGECLLTTECT